MWTVDPLDGTNNFASGRAPFAVMVGLVVDGTASGGMIPKVKCCMEAVDAGVEKAHILDGRVENCIILEFFTTSGIGTEIVCKRCEG